MSPDETAGVTGDTTATTGDATATDTARRDADPLLSVEDLRTHIRTDERTVHAVDGVSFTVDRGETVCLVGESGSGKSVTCESLTKLVPRPPAEFVGGTVTFDGDSLHDASGKRLRAIRGDRIAHIFQNPQQALDPVYTVGDQIVEAIRLHDDIGRSAARDRAVALLRRVGIPGAAERIDDYPHEFSGGMAQRVAIAIALAAEPDLLIADEPTTAVDVTVQARLIELLRELTDGGMAMLLVTHDFRVVASLADRVLVMFGGTIVERGPTEAVFSCPSHPYTQTLFESYDGLARRADRYAREDIPTDGCRFRKECPHAVDACAGGDQPSFHGIPEGAAQMPADETTAQPSADEGGEAATQPPADEGGEAATQPPADTDGSARPVANGGGRPAHKASCVHYAPDGDPADILAHAETVRPKGGEDDG